MVTSLYAAIVEQAVYGMGENALKAIDRLSSPTGSVFVFSVVISAVEVGVELRLRLLHLNLWGGIGKSGALYAVNLN